MPLLRLAIGASALVAALLVAQPAQAQLGEPIEIAGCASGSQNACQCPNGSWSRQTCDAGGFFTACACASASIDVPGFQVPNIDWNRPKKPKRRRSSGVGMLIGGLITLGLGTTSLAIGITLIREDTVVPLGIVLTATGGTAMAVGIPLSIVGAVNVANNDSRGYYNGSLPTPRPEWSLSPSSFKLSF
jgi:hypothetical protein